MDKKCKIYYFSFPNMPNPQSKLKMIREEKIQDTNFENIIPDKKGNWINQGSNDFEKLIPLCSKEVKAGKSQEAIFRFYAYGINTARDKWVYDFDKENLKNKTQFFIQKYDNLLVQDDNSFQDISIKWSEALKNYFRRKIKITFDEKLFKKILYRPFITKHYYAEKYLSDRLTQHHFNIFGEALQSKNKSIGICIEPQIPFSTLAFDCPINMHFLGRQTSIFPFYYPIENQRQENITDWALDLFRNHFQETSKVSKTFEVLSKKDIFYYIYAVLHNPAYRRKYEQNLKFDFPRIPLYDNFWLWAKKGKELIDLHLNYEKIKAHALISSPEERRKASHLTLRGLKANKKKGEIIIDENTILKGISPLAWEYKLGNRSALEWILDQYKEKKIRDKSIVEEFNTYCIANHKEEIIELLKKVCYISVETMKVIKELENI